MFKKYQKKTHFVLLIFFLLPIYLLGNTPIQDSLLTQLAKADDSTQLRILEELAMLPDISADERISYLLESVDLAQNLNNAVAKAMSLYQLGHAYMNKGDLDQALMVSMESLTLLNENNKALESTKVLTLIATINFYLENYEIALNHFEKALEISIELGDKLQIGKAMTNMGNIMGITGKLDEAMEYYKKALKIKEDFNDLDGKSQLYNNIANIYLAKGEMDEVLPYRIKALEMDRERGDKWQIALKTYNLAEYYLITKEPQKAYPLIIESKTIAEELENNGLINDNIHFLSMYYELLNDNKKALEYQRLYAQTIKETFSKELSDQVGEMEVKYEMEKKEKEAQAIKYQLEKVNTQRLVLAFIAIIGFLIAIFIFILLYKKRKDSQFLEKKVLLRTNELKQAVAHIKNDLQIKTALLQELHHRTKNNMAVISAMLSMQARRSDNDYVKTIFKDINNKIKAMSLVHQKLYQVKDLSNINLKEYIEELTTHIKQSYGVLSKNIEIKFEMQDVRILIDSAIPLGLIINELVSNIFKHAFPENQKGKIFIRLFKEENETINLQLSDNGVGLPQNFDVRKNGSMGLASVFSIAENQLQGEISVKSENGLKWHIIIKDNLHKARV